MRGRRLQKQGLSKALGASGPFTLDDERTGERWANILARRSPEGRALADQLWKAEKDALRAQADVTALKEAGEDAEGAFAVFTEAMNEVQRMRKVVYRMARQ